MARTMFVVAALALTIGLVAAQSPSPAGNPSARCLIFFEDGTLQDNSTKTCLDCQIQCVGLNDGQCGSYSWNGTLLQNPEEAPIFQCATLPVADDPAIGTCAFFPISAVYPTTFSLKYCDDCRALCVGDSTCDRIAWAGNVLSKGPELLSFACPPRPSPRPASPSIVPSPSPCTTPYAYISSNPQLSTLKGALDAAGLADDFTDSTSVATLFAPTNAAFTAALAALGVTEIEVGDTLLQILSFHVVPGVAATANTLTNGATLITALGEAEPRINVAVVPPAGPTFTPTATGTPASVVTADVRACQTVIHVIDEVLLPGIV